MYTKTFLAALTLGASCLAAPITKNEASMETTGFGIHKPRAADSGDNKVEFSTTGFGVHSRDDGKVSTTGFGVHSRDDGKVSTDGFGVHSRETREARGFGIHALETGFGIHSEGEEEDASKKTQQLQKRTGYGIISGNDDA